MDPCDVGFVSISEYYQQSMSCSGVAPVSAEPDPLVKLWHVYIKLKTKSA